MRSSDAQNEMLYRAYRTMDSPSEALSAAAFRSTRLIPIRDHQINELRGMLAKSRATLDAKAATPCHCHDARPAYDASPPQLIRRHDGSWATPDRRMLAAMRTERADRAAEGARIAEIAEQGRLFWRQSR